MAGEPAGESLAGDSQLQQRRVTLALFVDGDESCEDTASGSVRLAQSADWRTLKVITMESALVGLLL